MRNKRVCNEEEEDEKEEYETDDMEEEENEEQGSWSIKYGTTGIEIKDTL